MILRKKMPSKLFMILSRKLQKNALKRYEKILEGFSKEKTCERKKTTFN